MLITIFIILIILIMIIIFTDIKLDIENLEISNYQKEKIEVNYKIKFKFYLFKYIKYLSIPLHKLDLKSKIKIENIQNLKMQKLKIKISLESLNLRLKIDTIDMNLTSFLVLVVSIIIPYIINKTKSDKIEKYKYIVLPIYINKNIIDLHLSCIIKVKTVHIIKVIYTVLINKRGKKYERASNRKTDDGGNEQHKNNGRCRYNYR